MARRIDPSLIPSRPNLDFEARLWAQSLTRVAGVDEAGRGALAGPVYAAAVVLPADPGIAEELEGVRDSKEMQAKEREHWAGIIRHKTQWALGSASPEEIDLYRVVPATRLAAARALNALNARPEHLLVDGLILPEWAGPQTMLWKGDQRSLSVAAASVLAKVARDAELRAMDQEFPGYGFGHHKGYGTAAHKRTLETAGPSPIHRMSFAPLREQ